MKRAFLPRLAAAALLVVPPLLAVEHATYHSAGGLTSLVVNGAEWPVRGEFVVTFHGGVRQSLQPHDQRSPITREGRALKWKGLSTFPNGGQAQFEVEWSESDTGVTLSGRAISGGPRPSGATTHRWPLLVESVEYVLDVPRGLFVGGQIDSHATPLPERRAPGAALFTGETSRLSFVDGPQNWRLALQLDQPRFVTVVDRWDAQGRSYRVSIRLAAGVWPMGEQQQLGLTLQLIGQPHASGAQVSVDATTPRHEFDGFGGNYCFNTQTPVVDYTMDTLRQAWMRFELKGFYWDLQRAHPGPELLRDFQLMQRVQREGRPWIISLWRLPERYYADANQRPAGTFNRQIATDRWPEFLDLIGSYLLHVKQHYGAEPDMFSFNEPDLGVDIGFTAETHRDMIKRIGAHLASLGLKTKLLLGDTANPRDTHKYVLPTLADPEAMKYVAALSFHSWGNGTAEHYAAWREVAAWAGLPLLVGEAGTDPGAYRNATFDSYAYGLGELRQFQELLRHARPQALIYWEFTEDYGLAQVNSDQTIRPTPRYWLMKQMTNLTPLKSEGVACGSDQPDVFVSAFRSGESVVLHVLNTGARRSLTLRGLAAGRTRVVTTTEEQGYREEEMSLTPDQPLDLPARSLRTFISPR